jgi:hypothetical protein
MKPPTRHVTGPVVRSVTGLTAAPDLPSFEDRPAGVLPLGRLQGQRLVGVHMDDTLFTLLVGASGYGKTETSLNMAIALIRQRQGVWFVDPHGDALVRMKRYIGEKHVAERLVELNLGVAAERTPTWNLLAMAAERQVFGADLNDRRLRDAMERKQSTLTASFAAAVNWGSSNRRALAITGQAARSLLELALILPDDLAPTIYQLVDLLADDEWRRRVLPFLSRKRQAFWTGTFERLAAEAITPVTNLVTSMGESAAVVGLFGASVSTFDPRAAIDAARWCSSTPTPTTTSAGSSPTWSSTACAPRCSPVGTSPSTSAARCGCSSTRPSPTTPTRRGRSPTCSSRPASSGCGRRSWRSPPRRSPRPRCGR